MSSSSLIEREDKDDVLYQHGLPMPLFRVSTATDAGVIDYTRFCVILADIGFDNEVRHTSFLKALFSAWDIREDGVLDFR